MSLVSLPFDAAAARDRFVTCNLRTLEWMLGRPVLSGGFINTKTNSITGRDYAKADAYRGPDFTYGWIQGRGLEALITHAGFMASEDPALAAQLTGAARDLYAVLGNLFFRHGNHGYFCYDSELNPIVLDGAKASRPQKPAREFFTYSDIFVVKGLIAAAHRFGDQRALARYLDRLSDIFEAIDDNRFIQNERIPFDMSADPSRRNAFGPWMIMLGAGGLLHRLGLGEHAGFAQKIVTHVLERIAEGSALIPNMRGGREANPGHAIEFVGFALEAMPRMDSALAEQLRQILHRSFRAGFHAPGIVLSVDMSTAAPLSDKRPWWSLPETIRAAALTYERFQDAETAAIWQAADNAFFSHYWRGDLGFAYQTRDSTGPVDFVPATPDLDPGYHTGISLLAAIEMIDRQAGKGQAT